MNLAKASKLIYPSKWAANSAIFDYGVEPEKTEIIPFGANLDTVPLIDKVLSKKHSLPCRLLFIGREKVEKLPFKHLFPFVKWELKLS